MTMANIFTFEMNRASNKTAYKRKLLEWTAKKKKRKEERRDWRRRKERKSFPAARINWIEQISNRLADDRLLYTSTINAMIRIVCVSNGESSSLLSLIMSHCRLSVIDRSPTANTKKTKERTSRSNSGGESLSLTVNVTVIVDSRQFSFHGLCVFYLGNIIPTGFITRLIWIACATPWIQFISNVDRGDRK